MKRCSKCKVEKDEKFFNKKGSGLTARCKECLGEYWNSWYSNKENRQKHVAANVKLTKLHKRAMRDLVWKLKDVPCADCKEKYSPWVMQFDHLPQFKKVGTIQYMWTNGYSKKRILEEIAKCEVVCANCHADRTYKRMGRVLGYN